MMNEERDIVSNCCSAPMSLDIEDYGLCPACKEHCSVIDLNKKCSKCGEYGVPVGEETCEMCG